MSEDINNTVGTERVPTSGAFVGYNAVISLGNTPVSRVQRLSFSVNNNITQVFVVSSRTPLNVETRMVIKGTIRRLFFNTAMLRLTMGTAATSILDRVNDTFDVGTIMSQTDDGTPFFASSGTYRKVPPISILCQLNIENATGVYYGIKLSNVKFDSYDLTIDANTVILENVSFYAESIAITSAPQDLSGGSGGDTQANSG